MLRSTCLLVTLALGGLPLASAQESALPAQLVADVLATYAEDHPQYSAALRRLAHGVRSGEVGLDQAEQVLRIVALTTQSASVGSPQAPPPAAQQPEQVLGLLDGNSPGKPAADQSASPGRAKAEPDADAPIPNPSPASIDDLERWAGTRSPDLPMADEEQLAGEEASRGQEDPAPNSEPPQPRQSVTRRQDAPIGDDEQTDDDRQPAPAKPSLVEGSPTMNSDQEGLPAVNARVRLVQTRTQGERHVQVVYLDAGANQEIAEGHRLRVERGDQSVVLISIFNVRNSLSVGVVIEGSWNPQLEQEVKVGDRVVRDR